MAAGTIGRSAGFALASAQCGQAGYLAATGVQSARQCHAGLGPAPHSGIPGHV